MPPPAPTNASPRPHTRHRTKDPTKPPSNPLPDHFLVLPVAPCTGVESYVNTTGCGGEEIW